MNPDYLLGAGYDIALLELATPSTKTPAKVVGAGRTALWAPGVMGTIAGFGTTSEGGSTPARATRAARCSAATRRRVRAAGKPGVYARVGDVVLRAWIRSVAPAGVD